MKIPVHQITERVSGLMHIGVDPFTGKAFKMVYQKVRKGLGNLEHNGRDDLQLRVQAVIKDKKKR